MERKTEIRQKEKQTSKERQTQSKNINKTKEKQKEKQNEIMKQTMIIESKKGRQLEINKERKQFIRNKEQTKNTG